MTTTTTEVQPTSTADRGAATWSILARIEIARYARRPAFIVGTLLTYAALLPYLDPAEPVDELSMIAPAALIGLAGITISAQRVWASDRCARTAGATPVPEATRTIAHLVACLVPFLAGLGFVAISFARHLTDPAPPDGYTALMSDAWVASVWFGLGAMSCLGGPILGVLDRPCHPMARCADRGVRRCRRHSDRVPGAVRTAPSDPRVHAVDLLGRTIRDRRRSAALDRADRLAAVVGRLPVGAVRHRCGRGDPARSGPA